MQNQAGESRLVPRQQGTRPAESGRKGWVHGQRDEQPGETLGSARVRLWFWESLRVKRLRLPWPPRSSPGLLLCALKFVSRHSSAVWFLCLRPGFLLFSAAHVFASYSSPSRPTADQLQVSTFWLAFKFKDEVEPASEGKAEERFKRTVIAIHSMDIALNSRTDNASLFDRRVYYGQGMLRPYRSGISTVSHRIHCH